MPIREYPRHAELSVVSWQDARFSAKAVLIASEEDRTDFTSNYWPQKKGGRTEFQIDKEGTETNYLAVAMTEAGVVEIHFMSDVVHSLSDVDGLVDGDIRRIIHAGRKVKAKIESTELVGLTGPEDIFEVTSDVARIRLSRGVAQLESGKYSETELRRKATR